MSTQQNNFLIGITDSYERIFSQNNDYRHLLLMAPHGSGKGVCFQLPNLLINNESSIIHDIKMENYQLTAVYRALTGHKIFIFNPLDESHKTNRYNPLDFVSLNKEKTFNDIDKIANQLIKGEGTEKTACKNLLIALIFYLFANPVQGITLGRVAKIIAGDIYNELNLAIENFESQLNEFSLNQFKVFLNLDEKAQNSLLKKLNHYMSPWHNPLIDYATSASDFNFSDFKKTKITLYVGLLPSDIKRLQPFLNFFYEHILEKLMENRNPTDNYEEIGGVNLYFDEFYSLGRLAIVENAIGYLRGYKIRLFLVSSDFESLENIYGENFANILMANCFYKIFYTPKTAKSAQKISQIAFDNFNKTSLLTLPEILTLDSKKQIIIEGEEAKIINKFFYYEDSELMAKIEF